LGVCYTTMDTMVIAVTIRGSDVALFTEIAEREWRAPDQQGSAMMEATLNAVRAKANAAERPRPARRPSSTARAA